MKRILTTTVLSLSALTLLALPALATAPYEGSADVPAAPSEGGSEEPGEPVPAPDCESDADCSAGEVCLWNYCEMPQTCTESADCWTNWCEEGICRSAPSCAADTDCPGGHFCDYGYCTSTEGRCQDDGDCGEFQRCDLDDHGDTVVVGEGSVPPSSTDSDGESTDTDAEPTDPSGSSGSDGAPQAFPEEPAGAPSWGYCKVDPEQVPSDANCVALCAAADACNLFDGGTTTMEPTPAVPTPVPSEEGGSDSGEGSSGNDRDVPPSEDKDDSPEPPSLSDNVAFCEALCSYAVATGPDNSTDAVASLVACAEASSDSCDALVEDGEECSAEVEAVSGLFGDVVDDFDGGGFDESDDGQGGVTTTNTDSATGGADNPEAPRATDGVSIDDGGCNAGGGPVGSLLLFGLLGLLSVARRQPE